MMMCRCPGSWGPPKSHDETQPFTGMMSAQIPTRVGLRALQSGKLEAYYQLRASDSPPWVGSINCMHAQCNAAQQVDDDHDSQYQL